MKTMLLMLLAALLYAVAAEGQGFGAGRTPISVAVIAPSVSTEMEARRIVARQHWTIGKFKTADAILVVVRSVLSPLRSSYDFIGELREDADRQLNIAGPQFHVYLYRLGDDLDCSELKRINFDAE